MKVILKQNVPSLGKTGDLIKVNDGYGRNLPDIYKIVKS